jgi:hypothetical protein
MFHQIVHPDRGGDDAQRLGIDDEDHPLIGGAVGRGFGGLDYGLEEGLLDYLTEGLVGCGGGGGGGEGGCGFTCHGFGGWC